ncbi:MAG: sigma-70 family RNA polymerase sigma factor [Planctomycetes bacterium]|nr:sigma-70 family RNA polymerase sigma factor [Planctomycetota bacterium]
MPEFPKTNPSLILRVRDLGDGASWHDFLAIYEPVVFRMARQRGLQTADAQDVMQAVFLSISQSIARWTGGPNQPPFRAWLITIARNAITKALSRRPRDVPAGSTSIVELLHAFPQQEITADEIATETRHEIVRRACDQIRVEFSEDIWRIFWVTSIEGVPIAEVARQTGRTPGSIYVARFRVVARLKDKVREISEMWDVREVTT